MDEKNLKRLFIQSIDTGHIDGNNFLSINPENPDIEVRVKEEGYYRGFDLIIAVIKKRHSSQVESNWISSGDTYLNMIMRSSQLIQFAQEQGSIGSHFIQ